MGANSSREPQFGAFLFPFFFALQHAYMFHQVGAFTTLVLSSPGGRARSRYDVDQGTTHKYDPSQFKCIIIEVHHSSARSYRRIVDYFAEKPWQDDKDASCQEEKNEEDEEIKKESIRRVFGYRYAKSFLGMIEEEWLCNMRVTTVRTKLDLSSVQRSNATGDFHESDLSRVVNMPERNEAVVRTWLELVYPPFTQDGVDEAMETTPMWRRCTLAFAVDIQHRSTALFLLSRLKARPSSSKWWDAACGYTRARTTI